MNGQDYWKYLQRKNWNNKRKTMASTASKANSTGSSTDNTALCRAKKTATTVIKTVILPFCICQLQRNLTSAAILQRKRNRQYGMQKCRLCPARSAPDFPEYKYGACPYRLDLFSACQSSSRPCHTHCTSRAIPTERSYKYPPVLRHTQSCAHRLRHSG